MFEIILIYETVVYFMPENTQRRYRYQDAME
ncbi:Uncharacterised protein [Providencia rettgeri]|uniref:Uncharacterized protein n=1 Tax=Providencia rettgeri TaxID=587 RepID=A0A379FU08_PRORE|nr:Uncharacterised protein [Providencia rettgeri]